MLKKLLVLTCLLTVMGFANPFLATPEQAGITTYDYQQNGCVGNRIVLDKDGNAHIFWMHDAGTDATFPNRDIYYNFWNAGSSSFDFTGGTKASGGPKAGYCTGGVLSDGRAVVAFHQVSGAQTLAVVAVDATQGFGAFSTPVVIDGSKQVIWPHMVVGSDDVIHVVGHVQDTTGGADNVIYYSRSTDKGQTFSSWKAITDDAGNDPAIAVSDDGKKVAIAWSSGIGGPNYIMTHMRYVESTNGGVTWAAIQTPTDGRYLDPTPSETPGFIKYGWYGDYDCSYDHKGNLNITFCEFAGKFNSDETFNYYNINFKRPIHWNKANGFHLVSGPVTTYTPMAADTVVTSLDTLHMWGSGFNMVADYPGQAPYMGAWRPQSAAWGNDTIVVVWCGQWDSLDMNAAGRLNGDLYVAVSPDYGKTWRPLADWDTATCSHADSTKMYWTNITNTHTPAADPGACDGEDWFSIVRNVGSDNTLHITYILDKFSGSCLHDPTTNIITENPVMYLRYQSMKVGKPLTAVVESPLPQASSIELLGSGPYSSTVSFKVSAPATNTTLKIYNTSGALVETIVSGNVNSGTISWNASTVPAGVYFYSFSTPTKTSNGRFVVVH